MTSSNQSEKWQLSAYERQRLPHRVVTDETEVIAHEESFRSNLTCPICFGLFRNAVATTECLHRFCEECITTALRRCNKECPTCRRKLVSKRSLRRDYRMDAFIAALLPSHAEEPASLTEHVTASPAVQRGAPKQAREKSILKDSDVGQKPCGKNTRVEPNSTAIGGDLAPTTDSVGCAEEEADVQQISALTLPTRERRSWNEQQPRKEGRASPALAAGGDGVARKGSDRELTLRRDKVPQGTSAGACCADVEVPVEGTRVTSPRTPQVDPDEMYMSEETRRTARTLSAQCSEPTRPEDFCADTVETSGDEMGQSAAGADATPAAAAAASDRESSVAFAASPRWARSNLIAITLKPHLDMFLEYPESPTLHINVSARVTILYISSYLKKCLSQSSVNRKDRRFPMYRIYAASETGELVALPFAMTTEDAVKRIQKAGVPLEMYYALHQA
ncbi:E3 ubiquitin-protein ligase RING1-like [Dermacentor albipictus]|uniref:E3 ubiquitin-protein ligase RING1-like n=1 Tax=Dermacentor albipictus TaxID=60249 RepID=UPI0038FD2058